MKALILAGGLGTRLRPLTYTRPKHLLPIANRPHIEHVFSMLAASDVREIVMLTSYLADTFTDVVRRAADSGLHVEVAQEKEPLGTAGALKNAAAFVGDESFLAFNGDILTDVDLGSVVEWHRARRAEATIVLSPVEDPSAFGVVPTAADGRVLDFIEKPPRTDAPTNFINAGIYVFESSILERIPAGAVYSAERQLFPGLVDEGARLFALGTDAYWMDVGSPEKYLRANLDALAGRFKTNAVASPGDGIVLVGENASVDESASVQASCVGAGAVIAGGSVVERSVLLSGAEVGAEARVSDSILGDHARVATGARIAGATVADGETVS